MLHVYVGSLVSSQSCGRIKRSAGQFTSWSDHSGKWYCVVLENNIETKQAGDLCMKRLVSNLQLSVNLAHLQGSIL